jgi:hypothetical protein
VNNGDAMGLEFIYVLFWLIASRLNDPDSTLDDGLAIFSVWRRIYRRQECEIHSKGLAGHRSTSINLSS